MAGEEIKREVVVDPSVIPPLDPSILYLTEAESAFLQSAITQDDSELKKRIYEVQEIAYKQHPYPCIRAFHFVNLFMSVNPIYPEVLQAGKTGQTVLLDLGCCMGTDVRKLVSDGYIGHVFGCDLRQEFIDLGYQLYNDSPSSEKSTPIRFFTGDIFEVPAAPLSSVIDPNAAISATSKVTDLIQLSGVVNHIYTGALFHLFNEATQYSLALRLARIIKKEKGTIIFGRHQGLDSEGDIDDHLGRDRYGHSPSSWEALWKRVFAEVESDSFSKERVEVRAFLSEGFQKNVFKARHQTKMLVWSVRIL
ncbi:hypothetical protein ABKN59_009016 [Abortiporus biennis]